MTMVDPEVLLDELAKQYITEAWALARSEMPDAEVDAVYNDATLRDIAEGCMTIGFGLGVKYATEGQIAATIRRLQAEQNGA